MKAAAAAAAASARCHQHRQQEAVGINCQIYFDNLRHLPIVANAAKKALMLPTNEQRKSVSKVSRNHLEPESGAAGMRMAQAVCFHRRKAPASAAAFHQTR
jgi:hypothetical protein